MYDEYAHHRGLFKHRPPSLSAPTWCHGMLRREVSLKLAPLSPTHIIRLHENSPRPQHQWRIHVLGPPLGEMTLMGTGSWNNTVSDDLPSHVHPKRQRAIRSLNWTDYTNNGSDTHPLMCGAWDKTASNLARFRGVLIRWDWLLGDRRLQRGEVCGRWRSRCLQAVFGR